MGEAGPPAASQGAGIDRRCLGRWGTRRARPPIGNVALGTQSPSRSDPSMFYAGRTINAVVALARRPPLRATPFAPDVCSPLGACSGNVPRVDHAVVPGDEQVDP